MPLPSTSVVLLNAVLDTVKCNFLPVLVVLRIREKGQGLLVLQFMNDNSIGSKNSILVLLSSALI